MLWSRSWLALSRELRVSTMRGLAGALPFPTRGCTLSGGTSGHNQNPLRYVYLDEVEEVWSSSGIRKRGNGIMNRRQLLSLLGISPALLAASPADAERKKKDAPSHAGSEARLTAVSPKGTPPPIQLYSMAPRASSLDGKTIYVVDATSFLGSATLLHNMQAWFQRNMPNVKTVFRTKAGEYAADDPKLWAEIKANAYACVMAIGH